MQARVSMCASNMCVWVCGSVQRACVRARAQALWSLAVNSDNGGRIGELGGIEAVVDSMGTSHTSHTRPTRPTRVQELPHAPRKPTCVCVCVGGLCVPLAVSVSVYVCVGGVWYRACV